MRAAVLGLALGACASGAVGPASVGASIVRGDGVLYVASLDDDAVVAVDPDTLAEVARWPAPDEPERLAWSGATLVVTALRDTRVRLLEPATGAMRDVVVPCGGTRGLAVDEAGVAWVACPHDGRVVAIDVAAGSVREEVVVGGRPGAVAWDGARLLVSDRLAGTVRTLDGGEVARMPDDVDPSDLDSLAVGGGEVLGVAQHVDHDGDRDRPPEDGGYGDAVDGEPRIEARLLGPCPSRYAAFDGTTARVFSGPSALAWDAAGRRLWVVHRATRNVAVLACDADEDGRARLLLHARVGAGARGIALSDDGRTAWIDDAFEPGVSRIDLPDALDGRIVDATSRARDLGPSTLGAEARRGRAVFHDALDVQLTPSGIVACATCHPDGGEDGLAWFLHTADVARKLRRTPPAWAVDDDARPLHWDGEFPEATDLVRSTIRGLMGGQALLVDADAVAAWMRERTPPVPPPARPDAARGASLAAEVGCLGCHVDGGTDGLAHDVVPPSADPDGVLGAAITPSLRGVRARAPFLHDGRATTLRSVLVEHDPQGRHGGVAARPEADLDALVAWMESL